MSTIITYDHHLLTCECVSVFELQVTERTDGRRRRRPGSDGGAKFAERNAAASAASSVSGAPDGIARSSAEVSHHYYSYTRMRCLPPQDPDA